MTAICKVLRVSKTRQTRCERITRLLTSNQLECVRNTMRVWRRLTLIIPFFYNGTPLKVLVVQEETLKL
jgi:hypothetical protein